MGQDYSNRRYITFDVTEVGKVDFSQVDETSAATLRKSVDELKAVIKYELPAPSSVVSLTTKSSEYTHEAIIVLMGTSEWSSPPII